MDHIYFFLAIFVSSSASAIVPGIVRVIGRAFRNFKFVALSDEDRVRFGLWFFGRTRVYGFGFMSVPAQPMTTV